mmetsp:Transcript_62945/g.165069  ORF Transcript_62945/g.165069 Transcript_62945/m.165069 type:complete len:512 (-) Transcript_62945:468-2003(-)
MTESEAVSHEDRHRKDGTEVWQRELEDIVRTVVWSPKGDFVLAGTVADQKVTLLDARPSAHVIGMVVWSRRCDGQVESLAYHPDGKCVAIGTGRYKVTVADAQTSNKLWEKRLSGGVQCLSFTATGYQLVAGLGLPQQKIVMMDVAEGDIIWQHDMGDWIRTLMYYPTVHHIKGNRLLIGTATTYHLMLLNAPDKSTPSTQWTLNLDARVESVAYSIDGRRVAAAAGVKVFCVDEMSGSKVWSKKLGSGGVQSVRFAPSCRHLAATSSDEKVFVLDVHSGDTVWTKDMHCSSMVLDFAPSGDFLAVGTSSFRVIVISFRHTARSASSLVQKARPEAREAQGERPGTALTAGGASVLGMSRPGTTAAGASLTLGATGLLAAAGGQRPSTANTWPQAAGGLFKATAPTWSGGWESRPSAQELGWGSTKSCLRKSKVRAQSLVRSTPILLGIPSDLREEWARYKDGSGAFGMSMMKDLPIPRATPADWYVPPMEGTALPGARAGASSGLGARPR